MSIAHWGPGEGPRDKLLERGAMTLSDAELLAVLLQCGYRERNAVDMARDLLARFGECRQFCMYNHRRDIVGVRIYIVR